MCVCVVVLLRWLGARARTPRLLDMVAMRFLPFTYATGLLLLSFVRYLLAQMATRQQREREKEPILFTLSVNMWKRKKKRGTEKRRKKF